MQVSIWCRVDATLFPHSSLAVCMFIHRKIQDTESLLWDIVSKTRVAHCWFPTAASSKTLPSDAYVRVINSLTVFLKHTMQTWGYKYVLNYSKIAIFVLIREQCVSISKHLAICQKRKHIYYSGVMLYFGNHKLRNNEWLGEVTEWNTWLTTQELVFKYGIFYSASLMFSSENILTWIAIYDFVTLEKPRGRLC